MGRRRPAEAYPILIDELAVRGLRVACRKMDLKPVPEDPYGANRLGEIHPFAPPTRSEGGFSRQVVEKRPRVCRWTLSHPPNQKRDRLARRRPQASHRCRAPAVRVADFFRSTASSCRTVGRAGSTPASLSASRKLSRASMRNKGVFSSSASDNASNADPGTDPTSPLGVASELTVRAPR